MGSALNKLIKTLLDPFTTFPEKMLIHTLLIFVILVATRSASAIPSSYAVWAADSGISRGQGNGLSGSSPLVSYEHGLFQWGLRLLYERSGNETYFNYIRDGVNRVVSSNGTIGGGYRVSDFSLDPVRTGPSFLYLNARTNDTRYKIAAETYKGQLDGHPRTGEGQFWHKLRYPNQGWLDGVYMGDVFYTQYVRDFQPNNDTAWADIASQVTLMYENTLRGTNESTAPGLLYHGYDFSHTTVWASPDRGHSPEVWDRALGWYSMALVDILSTSSSISGSPGSGFPQSHPGYNQILTIIQTLFPRIAASADPDTGAWWLVITQPGRAKNYFESSGTAMFVYSLLRAVRLGLVDDTDGALVSAAKKAYEYSLRTFVVDDGTGRLNWLRTVVVGSLDRDGSFDYYVNQSVNLNDLKGLGAFLLASLEYEALPS